MTHQHDTPGTDPILGRPSWPEAQRIGDILRAETVGGMLLIVAAVVALT